MISIHEYFKNRETSFLHKNNKKHKVYNRLHLKCDFCKSLYTTYLNETRFCSQRCYTKKNLY